MSLSSHVVSSDEMEERNKVGGVVRWLFGGRVNTQDVFLSLALGMEYFSIRMMVLENFSSARRVDRDFSRPSVFHYFFYIWLTCASRGFIRQGVRAERFICAFVGGSLQPSVPVSPSRRFGMSNLTCMRYSIH